MIYLLGLMYNCIRSNFVLIERDRERVILKILYRIMFLFLYYVCIMYLFYFLVVLKCSVIFFLKV